MSVWAPVLQITGWTRGCGLQKLIQQWVQITDWVCSVCTADEWLGLPKCAADDSRCVYRCVIFRVSVWAAYNSGWLCQCSLLGVSVCRCRTRVCRPAGCVSVSVSVLQRQRLRLLRPARPARPPWTRHRSRSRTHVSPVPTAAAAARPITLQSQSGSAPDLPLPTINRDNYIPFVLAILQ